MAIPIVIALVAAGVLAVGLLRAPTSSPTLVYCYSRDSLNSGVTSAVPYSSNWTSTCLAKFGRASPRGSAPSELPCVLPDGMIGAFPESEKNLRCSTLGLDKFDETLTHPHNRSFERSIRNTFSRDSCYSPVNARKTVLQFIGRFGIVGWRVSTFSSSPSLECATVKLDHGDRYVIIRTVSK
jgi:hypothetical protein